MLQGKDQVLNFRGWEDIALLTSVDFTNLPDTFGLILPFLSSTMVLGEWFWSWLKLWNQQNIMRKGFLPKLISHFFTEIAICRAVFLGWCHGTKLRLEVWRVGKRWKKEKMKKMTH